MEKTEKTVEEKKKEDSCIYLFFESGGKIRSVSKFGEGVLGNSQDIPTYDIEDGGSCTCKGFQYRGDCRHVTMMMALAAKHSGKTLDEVREIIKPVVRIVEPVCRAIGVDQYVRNAENNELVIEVLIVAKHRKPDGVGTQLLTIINGVKIKIKFVA